MYFIINLISDMFNNFVFVLINLSIDIYMLIRLRTTLNEKLEGLRKMYQMDTFKQNGNVKNQEESNKKTAQKELELQEAMNNAIRMVVLNSTLNIIFKLPLAFGPFVNALAAFYYQSDSYKQNILGYHIFMRKLKLNGLFYLIPDFGDWLLTFLLAIQLFIYARFDKKIRMGLDRFWILVKEIKKKPSNVNNGTCKKN